MTCFTEAIFLRSSAYVYSLSPLRSRSTMVDGPGAYENFESAFPVPRISLLNSFILTACEAVPPIVTYDSA